MEGRDNDGAAGWLATAERPSTAQLVGLTCAAGCIAILVAKLLFAPVLNVHWDEFFFLSHVHALVRGDLVLWLQGAYTHAFRWVTTMQGDELEQIRLLRQIMWVLLVVSCALLYLLARLWTSRAAALVAVLAFLSTWPVLRHGASFRAEALILPLMIAAFLFALRNSAHPLRSAAIAGMCLGLALVTMLDSALLLPALVVAAALPDSVRRGPSQDWRVGAIPKLAVLAGVALALAALLLASHSTQVNVSAGQTSVFASYKLNATIIDIPFAPGRNYLVRLVAEDPLFWTAVLAGLLVALRFRAWSAAAMSLALLPLVFDHYTLPHFYPVVMAPAAILIAVAADRLLPREPVRAFGLALSVLVAGIAGVLAGAYEALMTLRFDGQSNQRAIVAAVHQIFPEPVPYLDHSGVIATFPKVNFIMSSSGLESYLRAGNDFMPQALAGDCPPLLLIDHPLLYPRTLLYRRLRETDRQLLETRYVDYWRWIRVAGAEIRLPGTLRVPCTGDYRVETDGPVLLDGNTLVNDDVITLDGERDYRFEADSATAPAGKFRLVWAAARPPPTEPPPRPGLYSPL